MSGPVLPELEADFDTGGQPDPAPTRWRYLLYAVGVVMIVVGAKGIAHNSRDYENPTYWLKLFIGGAVAHDLVIAPVVAVIGYVLVKLVPGRFRGPIQMGLFASAVFVAISLPGLRGYGKDAQPGNTSIHPLNYTRGLIIVLAVVWALVLAVLALRLVRARRSGGG